MGRAKFGDEAGDGPPAVLKIMVVFSMVSVFWALFDQHASTWVDQAKQMALGLTVPPNTGYWALIATLGLSLYAGVWLFRWLVAAPLPKRLTIGVLVATLGLGLAAGVCDLIGLNIANIVTRALIQFISSAWSQEMRWYCAMWVDD